MLLFLTIVSLVAAAASAAVAWRLVRDERRRSEARVAALIASLDAPPADEPEPSPAPEPAVPDRWEDLPDAAEASPLAAAPSAYGALFSDATRPDPPDRSRLAAVGVVASILVGAIALSWLTARALAPAGTSANENPAPTATVVQPLELLALNATRQGQDLAIAGLVRNPSAGGRVERVAAVVLLFDDRGGFLTSVRAPLDVRALEPGDESPFLLTVTALDRVSRYRLSFRVEDGGVVPHVDRRPTATGGPGAPGGPAARRAGL